MNSRPLLIIGILVTGYACERGDGGPQAAQASPVPTHEGTAAEQASDAALITTFYHKARSDLTEDGLGHSTLTFIESLPRAQRILIARTIISDKDARFRIAGANLLVLLGFEEEAIPHLGNLVASGNDLSGLAYSWMHASNDPYLTARMTLKIGYWLLAAIDSLPKNEQDNVKKYFLPLTGGDSIASFSKAGVLDRFHQLEDELKKTPPTQR